MATVIHFLSFLGRPVLDLFRYFGRLFFLLGETFVALFSRPRLRLVAGQVVSIGLGSQPVIIVTGAFTGAVFAAQMYFAFSGYGLGTTVGAVVSVAICRELGPVLAALMVSGRVGAAMAAQIGTMKVTDQIDALRTMGVDPVEYLVVPRFLGMTLSMPVLLAETIGFGLLASHLLVVHLFHVPEAWYGYQTWLNTNLEDLLIGAIKSLIFGAIIVLVSCDQGFRTRFGTSGVGKATTAAVVSSSLLVVMSNLFLTLILNQFFPLRIIAY